MRSTWHIGVIGGTGLYDAEILEDVQEIPVKSPFGAPSGPVTTGSLAGVRFTFLARHGAGHRLPPSAINYRANIDVLKRCGVTDLVSVSAVGSLREGIVPGAFVAVDQMIDCTRGRERSFFGKGLAAHVSLAQPTCSRLSRMLCDAASMSGAKVHPSGCYLAIEGPQFSTRAESRLYRTWGADVIGMTGMPEARLAREAELPYALLAMVTDFDCWQEGSNEVEVAQILAVLRANVSKAKATLRQFAEALPRERTPSPIDTALDGAIITAPAQWDRVLAAKLGAVAGRVLGRGA